MTAELYNHVNENVLAEWVDGKTGQMCTLGSLSAVNKQSARLSLLCGFDAAKALLFARLSLIVSVRVAGHHRSRELLLVLPIPPSAAGGPRDILGVDTLPVSAAGISAPAAHDAGLSESGLIIRARFSLSETTVALMFVSRASRLRPSTTTGSRHLAAFRSLSQAREFTVYLQPSDYARQGLALVVERLRDSVLKQAPLELRNLCGDKGAQALDWQQWAIEDATVLKPRLESCPSAQEAPPLYCDQVPGFAPTPAELPPSPPPPPPPGYLSPAVLVRCSRSRSPEAVPETPPANDEFNRQEDLAGPCDQARKRRRHESLSSPSNSVKQNGRLREQQQETTNVDLPALPAASISRDALTYDVIGWLVNAKKINEEITRHKRLRPHLFALGKYAGECNLEAYRIERARCSTIFYYDPHGVAADADFDSLAARHLLHKMYRLVMWINDIRRYGDALWTDELLNLGLLARAAASGGEQQRGAFEDWLTACEGYVIVGEGRVDNSHRCSLCSGTIN